MPGIVNPSSHGVRNGASRETPRDGGFAGIALGEALQVTQPASGFVGGGAGTGTTLPNSTNLKLREDQLRHAHETLEDAIEALSDGFALFDANNRLVMCNSRFVEFHTQSANALVPGVAWDDMSRICAEGDLACNREFRQADGRWFAYTRRRTRRDGLVLTCRDISQRKEMEQALRDSESLVRRVLEACPLPVRMWNPESGQVLYESPACSALFGRDATTLAPGHCLSAYVDPTDRERYLRQLRVTGAVDSMEMRLQHSGGGTFCAAVSARLIEHQGEEVVVSTIVDLSEYKAMEQAQRDSGEIVRQVLEACPVVLTMNRADDGAIIYESPATQKLLRYDEPQEGKSVSDRWANADDRQAYLKRLRRGGAVDGLEVRFKKADGEEFPCALSSRLIEYQGEEVIVSHLFDLTERREVEAELDRQRELLHQAEKLGALGELLAGVSHELNNPLSVLVGQASMLRESAPDARTTERAERIGKAANRCAAIVKTFLAMARQDSSASAPIDLNAAIHGALEVTAYSLRTGGIDVSLRLARELPPVMADADQMRQVLTNLIVNGEHALQDPHGPRRLRISSSYRKRTDEVVVKVKDNGSGVPDQIKTRIFEPLFTTKDVGIGTGMGLALCHRIMEAHGGSIVVEKAAGEGAVFAIRLPAAQPEPTTKKPPRGRRKVSGCRVLVVDDEEDVGQILSDILEYDGHSVEIAGSGTMALEKLKRRQFDVILSDIRMPGMDGPAFYRALRDVKPERIDGLAFITGDTLTPRVKEFLDAAERPYLEKPLAPEDVRELVDLLMRRKAS